MRANETSSPVQNVQIDESHDGQRLDNYMINRLKNVPKTKAYKLIRTGQVRVNSKRAKPSTRLAFGDIVRIPPFTFQPSSPNHAPNHLKHLIEQRIVYEDKHLLILNKPSGMAVHGGSGVSLGIIETLRQLRPQQKFIELVHRLDRETSGCLLIAKSRKMLVYLHQLLREAKIKKTYLALVHGCWNAPSKVVMPLSKNHLRSGERVVKVDTNGKEAITIFKAKQNFENATLLEASPITGRTHQIRVHASYMGHPIAGDQKYGTRPQNEVFSQIGLKRLFLHASSIHIPMTEQEDINIFCELDDSLKDVLAKL